MNLRATEHIVWISIGDDTWLRVDTIESVSPASDAWSGADKRALVVAAGREYVSAEGMTVRTVMALMSEAGKK